MPVPKCDVREGAILDYSIYAAEHGWNARSLCAFCAQHGISPVTCKRLWPRAHRSASWDLNALADRAMALAAGEKPSLASLIELRFKQNRHLRGSVRRLAFSDCFHPLDTLRRTRSSIRLMLATAGLSPGRSTYARLIAAYSACVILWIADPSRRQAHSLAKIRPVLKMFGLPSR